MIRHCPDDEQELNWQYSCVRVTENAQVTIPRHAAPPFLAGEAYVTYRRFGGKRSSTLPDFFIGAHAAVADLDLVTRDATRYQTYFPTVRLTAPRS